MRNLARFQSLRANVIIWIILPFTLVLVGILMVSALFYQNIITRLVLERHQHLASVAAVSVAQSIEGYAHMLEALGSQTAIKSESQAVQAAALAQAAQALDIFSAGVMIVDRDGQVVNATSVSLAREGAGLLNSAFSNNLYTATAPAYSDVVWLPGHTNSLVLVAVPLSDARGVVASVLIGGLYLDTAAFSQPIQKLSEPGEGFVYLVDQRGNIISHPDTSQIGAYIPESLLVQNFGSDQNAGMLWQSPAGDRFVTSSVQVSASGWRLIYKEPWEAVISSTRFYGAVILAISLLVVFLVSLIAWRGTGLVTIPIRKLADQTTKLSRGDSIEPIAKSRIYELDQLGAAFENMSLQIVAYRDGLRRYVGAITSSQEEERLRIARELHDEIIQNLLTISRKIELVQVTSDQQEQARQLEQLKDMTYQITQEVRQISQDLRPMMLEDLGLVPAIRMLVNAVHQGRGAVPHANFTINGSAEVLNEGQELALYRIIQEALTNVRKHACATGVKVTLDVQPNEAQLSIQDDGKGFIVPPSMTELVQQGSLGLMGIQERVWAVEGRLSIVSTPGQGTRIDISLPL